MKHLLLICQLGVSIPCTLWSQDGVFDETFGIGGELISDIPFNYDYSSDMAIDPDGNIFIAGSSWTNYNYQPIIVKHLPDGDLDYTFGNNGALQLVFPLESTEMNVYAIDLDQYGNMYLGCSLSKNYDTYSCIIKVLSNGVLDLNFGSNGIAILDSSEYSSAMVDDIKVLTNGTIYWCGRGQLQIMTFDDDCLTVGKCLPDGQPDTTFASDGLFKSAFGNDVSSGRKLFVQGDGKVLVGGNTSNDFGFIRLTSNGTLDPAFGNMGTAVIEFTDDVVLYDIGVLSNGHIIACGYTESGYSGACEYGQTKIALAMLTENGQPDSQFDDDGKLTFKHSPCNDESYCLLVQPDDKILIGGGGGSFSALEPHHYQVLRYTPDGTLDQSFGTNGYSIAEFNDYYNYAHTLAFQPDGRAIITGVADEHDIGHTYFYSARITTGVNPEDLVPETPSEPSNNHLWMYQNILYSALPDSYPYSTNIYSLQGALVASFTIETIDQSFSLSNLPPAIYTVQVIGDYYREAQKVVVLPNR